MKIYLIKEFWDEDWKEVLPVNNWYEGVLTPIMYDPQTLQQTSPAYIIKCNDGKFRKAGAEYFLTIEEWRQRQLDKIL
jgi:hypothetical protein